MRSIILCLFVIACADGIDPPRGEHWDIHWEILDGDCAAPDADALFIDEGLVTYAGRAGTAEAEAEPDGFGIIYVGETILPDGTRLPPHDLDFTGGPTPDTFHADVLLDGASCQSLAILRGVRHAE